MTVVLKTGDIWDSPRPQIVIPVNCVGVAGAGLAKQAAEKSHGFVKGLRSLNLRPGDVAELPTDERIIVAATKDHWRHPSRPEWVLAAILTIARSFDNCALPLLGTGLGGLDKFKVLQDTMKILSSATHGRGWDIYVPRFWK